MEGFSKIGIDWWSVLLYLINYGILLFVLAKFVYPRVLAVIDARRSLIANNISDADMLRAELSKQNDLAEQDRKTLLATLEEETKLVKKELQQKRKELLEQMTKEKDDMMAEAKAAIIEEKQQLITQVQNKLVEVIQAAILNIANTKVSEEDVQASISKAWQTIDND